MLVLVLILVFFLVEIEKTNWILLSFADFGPDFQFQFGPIGIIIPVKNKKIKKRKSSYFF